MQSPRFSSLSMTTLAQIDFRETAPAAANETMYVDDPTKSTIGGLAVGVPGALFVSFLCHS